MMIIKLKCDFLSEFKKYIKSIIKFKHNYKIIIKFKTLRMEKLEILDDFDILEPLDDEVTLYNI